MGTVAAMTLHAYAVNSTVQKKNITVPVATHVTVLGIRIGEINAFVR
jgi:hypothetical protein